MNTDIYNPFRLENKTVLVTGASSGIGRAIAIECSKMGAKVFLTARSEERLNDTLHRMDNPERHVVLPANLLEKQDINSLVDKISENLDGIVQCAGVTNPKPFYYFQESDIESLMKVNFYAPFLLIQSLFKKKKIKRKGSVVFISSISGVYVSSVGGSLYSASKGAVNGIIKGLALELAPKSIRVNSVNPGMIETNIFDSGIIDRELLNEDSKRYPLKRYGRAEEVAYAVIYLLSDATAWMTGSNIKIDGGYTLL